MATTSVRASERASESLDTTTEPASERALEEVGEQGRAERRKLLFTNVGGRRGRSFGSGREEEEEAAMTTMEGHTHEEERRESSKGLGGRLQYGREGREGCAAPKDDRGKRREEGRRRSAAGMERERELASSSSLHSATHPCSLPLSLLLLLSSGFLGSQRREETRGQRLSGERGKEKEAPRPLE